MRIQIYVCPNSCGNYYGSSGMPELGSAFTGPKLDDKPALKEATGSPYKHTRRACPGCRQRGVAIERALVTLDVDISKLEAPPTPALPTS